MRAVILHVAVRFANAAGQYIAGHRRSLAARLGRHDEVLGTVEDQKDLFGQRSRELADAVTVAAA